MATGDVATAGVLLSGFNEETREAVAICLERRDVVALAVDRNQTMLMGRSESLVDTFRAALELASSAPMTSLRRCQLLLRTPTTA